MLIGNQPSSNGPGIVTPENVMTQKELNEALMTDVAALMQSYGAMRQFCMELGEKYNGLVREYNGFKGRMTDLEEQMAELKERFELNNGVSSVTANFGGPDAVSISK